MKKFLLFFSFIGVFSISAQITGSKTIGVDYATLNIAFAALNSNGVGAGGVTINIPAGYTETSPSGGFLLGSQILNASLSINNPLIIQKIGSGANPLFTGTAGTGNFDSIFKFSGVDYITLDGLDLNENPTNITTTTLNEFGFNFVNMSSTDGCNFNIVKNCTITFLKSINNVATAINFVHMDGTGNTMSPTNGEGTHSNNKIYGNYIMKSLYNAINFYSTPLSPNLYDQNNDIGGTSLNTANFIIDLGGVSADGSITGVFSTNYGISANNQNNANVSNNTINFASDSYGTIGIELTGINSSFTVNNNIINAIGRPTLTGEYHYGISIGESGSGADLTANGNVINISSVSTGIISYVYGIIFRGNGSFTGNGNKISGTSSGGIYGILSNASTALSLNNNIISDLGTSTSIKTVYGIYLAVTATTGFISRNKIYNLTANASAIYGIYVSGSAANTTTTIYNNLIGNFTKNSSFSTSTLSMAGINLSSTGANSKLNVYYNSIFLNASSTAPDFNTTGIFHTSNAISTTASLDLRNNIIVNRSTTNGTGTASALRRSSAGVTNYAPTSNNNNFYATSGVYFDGTSVKTLAQLQAYSRDANSLNVNPVFASITGVDANYLNLDSHHLTNETLDNQGIPINGITVDFTNATRSATTPDIGAYEFAYTLSTAEITKNRIYLYPNPFQDIIKISNIKDVKFISITDVSGRLIKNMKASSEIQLSDLNTGFYIINLHMKNDMVKSIKVIKK